MVERDHVQIRVERGQTISTLEIDVSIPNTASMLLAAGS
jgi:septum formation topological specificity factor MinE